MSWNRTTSGNLGQLHRNFSLEIGCRYEWTTLEFRRIRCPADIEIRYFGVLSVMEQNDIWISRATSQTFFSRDWLSLWRNDIRFWRIRFPTEIEIRYFGMLIVFEQNDIWISRATWQKVFSRDWLSLWRNEILFFGESVFGQISEIDLNQLLEFLMMWGRTGQNSLHLFWYTWYIYVRHCNCFYQVGMAENFEPLLLPKRYISPHLTQLHNEH